MKKEKKLPVGEAEVAGALATLAAYKRGKANLERRVVEDERWYQLRHWDVIRGQGSAQRPEPASAWLFNAIMNKHADAMDNFPEARVLPREQDDVEEARRLSAVLPVILERCGFEGRYSDAWWEKLKHGTAVYAPLWNSGLNGGLGDVEVGTVDLLNIFWEPGITDIQKSRNLFVVDVKDNDLLEGEYPQLEGKLRRSGGVDVTAYVYDDSVDLSGKSAVIDWYYKVRRGGRTVLHYAKLCAGELLFASENDSRYAQRGWYDHGEYPFVFDTLFPEKGTPVGFGYVALCKDPQLYIDKLSQIMLENAMMSGKKRFFIGGNTGVNEEEFLDWSAPLVHVEGAGNLDEAHIREIVTQPLDEVFLKVLRMKIDELKETSANRDVSQGSSSSGVTSAAGIAALQEAGNKSSRDMIAASYRAYVKLGYLIIELIRQFYSQGRSFRMVGPEMGESRFAEYSNAGLQDRDVGADSAGNCLVRRPVFDIKIRAQKKNPFSQASQNQLAKELYAAGFFDPQRAGEALAALELMDFEGKDKVTERVLQTLEEQSGAEGADQSQACSPARELKDGNGATARMARAQRPGETAAQRLARQGGAV